MWRQIFYRTAQQIFFHLLSFPPPLLATHRITWFSVLAVHVRLAGYWHKCFRFGSRVIRRHSLSHALVDSLMILSALHYTHKLSIVWMPLSIYIYVADIKCFGVCLAFHRSRYVPIVLYKYTICMTGNKHPVGWIKQRIIFMLLFFALVKYDICYLTNSFVCSGNRIMCMGSTNNVYGWPCQRKTNTCLACCLLSFNMFIFIFPPHLKCCAI